MTVARTAAAAIAGGYQATVKVSMKGLKVAQQISLDVVVNNDGETGSFNDLTGKQESSSKYYAVATMKPGIEKIPYGIISIDADADAAWGNAVNIPLTINKGSEASANAKVLWDDDNLYVYATVKDAVLDKTGAQTHEQDSLEVFIDEDNGKTASYGEDDKQYRINYNNEQSFNGKNVWQRMSSLQQKQSMADTWLRLLSSGRISSRQTEPRLVWNSRSTMQKAASVSVR